MEDQAIGTTEEMPEKNGTAKAVQAVGFMVIILGVVAASLIAQDTPAGPGNGILAFGTFSSLSITGTVLIALAEIINLLDKPEPKTEEL